MQQIQKIGYIIDLTDERLERIMTPLGASYTAATIRWNHHAVSAEELNSEANLVKDHGTDHAHRHIAKGSQR